VALTGLSQREIDVIGLVAEGLETREIAAKLSYSERTIKNVLQGMMLRLACATGRLLLRGPHGDPEVQLGGILRLGLHQPVGKSHLASWLLRLPRLLRPEQIDRRAEISAIG
jgi:hypothetical protein